MQSNRNICSVMSASKRVGEKDSVYDSGLLQFSKKEFLISWQTSQLIWVLHCPGVNINIWIPWLQISIFEQPVAGGLDVMERTPEIHSYTALLDQSARKCASQNWIFFIFVEECQERNEYDMFCCFEGRFSWGACRLTNALHVHTSENNPQDHASVEVTSTRVHHSTLLCHDLTPFCAYDTLSKSTRWTLTQATDWNLHESVMRTSRPRGFRIELNPAKHIPLTGKDEGTWLR